MVRDIRIANELHARGYPVHVWWTVDYPKRSGLRSGIKQHFLFNGLRYVRVGPFVWPRFVKDCVGRFAAHVMPDGFLSDLIQRRPWAVHAIGGGIISRVCQGGEADGAVLRRFACQLSRHRVTHVLPVFAMLGQWVLDAGKFMDRPPRLLITFHGYEVIANYARLLGLEQSFYDRLRQIALCCDVNPIAVSADYASRVVQDLGLSPDSLSIIPPGIPIPPSYDRSHARSLVAAHFKHFRPEVPLVTYLGRIDAEKGVDLLLYAAFILRSRGIPLQLAVCGPTSHSSTYADACRRIAENLRCPVLWTDFVPDGLRDAMYAASHVVVCPSIHREPFGMVPVEAMSFGTPVLVPDLGGTRDVVSLNGRTGGLIFRSCDSGHLAQQLAALLTDQPLWQRLAAAAPVIASSYSIKIMTDRILRHLDLPVAPENPIRPKTHEN
jgi:glycosyltransferase involved in cell wall biosynthesis